MRLESKVAIITGAARGIGAATAARFVREGAKVMITDVLRDEGEKTAKQLGDAVSFCEHDVRDEKQWQTAVKKTVDTFGTVDVLVNNAGYGGVHFEVLETLPVEVARNIFDINVMGTFLGMKAVIAVMKKAGAGSIINISSTAAQSPINSLSMYSASKAAVSAMTKSVSLELGQLGIRVNSIHPGGANTKMANFAGLEVEEFNKSFSHVALHRCAEPEEIASGVVFFASDDSSYCAGSELLVDGGQAAGIYFEYLPGHPKMPINKIPPPKK